MRAPTPVADHAKAFDFWIGSWKLTWGDTNTASNTITREFNGHVIKEHFVDSAEHFNGESWSVYDKVHDRWRQTWVDDQGGYFALSGGWQGDRMVLETQPEADGLRYHRMEFHDIRSDGFIWDWSLTTDGGKTWTLKWRIKYARTG